MKINMICIKFDQKIKKTLNKPKFWTFQVFLGFKKKPIFQLWYKKHTLACPTPLICDDDVDDLPICQMVQHYFHCSEVTGVVVTVRLDLR